MEYMDQCVVSVQRQDGSVARCRRESTNRDKNYLVIVPLCEWHIDRATAQLASTIIAELNEIKESVTRHECVGDRAVEQYMNDRANAQIAASKRHKEDAFVYFMRCGKYVKIGASSSPLYRLRTIRDTGGLLHPNGIDLSKTHLLKVLPGGFALERELHKRFKHIRRDGEWFDAAPELLAYIQAVPAEINRRLPAQSRTRWNGQGA